MAWAAGLAAVIHLAVAGMVPMAVFLAAFRGAGAADGHPGLSAGAHREGVPLAVLGIWPAFVIILAGLAFAGVPGGLEGAIRTAVLQGLQRMGSSPEQFPVAQLVQVMAAAVGFWSAVSLSVNGTAAQSALARTGLALSPTPRWSEVRLPFWYPALPGAGAAAWLAFGGEGDVVALSVLLVLLLPVFLQGIAAVHRRSAGRPGRNSCSASSTAGLVILSVPAAVAVTAFGFYEQWGRRTSARRQDHDRTHPDAARRQAARPDGRAGEGAPRLRAQLPAAQRQGDPRQQGQPRALRARNRRQLEAQNIKRREETERVAERVHGLSVTIIARRVKAVRCTVPSRPATSPRPARPPALTTN